ncbi:MAG: diaminopimelate epimerase [Armatimonadota bacterium]
MAFSFSKMQGAGNDFVVVEGAERVWAALAPALSSRHFGAGSDGVLVALPSTVADIRMRMYNPDGTEDECGNGLRCLALYAYRRSLVSRPEFRVETLSGVRAVEVHDTGGREVSVTTDLGRAELSPAAVPVLHDGPDALRLPLEVDGTRLEVHSVSTGTAHTVIYGIPEPDQFARLSPQIEHHPLFPERTSIMWTEVDSPEQIRLRIWERGAGETLACGTGSAAAAVVSHLLGKTGARVAVTSKGGTLHVEIAEDLSLRLTGPAAFVYEATWPEP